MNKEEKDTQNAEVEIIGKAANPDAVAELTAEVERLKAENAELKRKADKAEDGKNTWIRIYRDKETEADHLRGIVKALNAFANLV